MRTLLIALLFLGTHARAQITLEHTYPGAGFFSNYKQLMMVELEASGWKYVAVDAVARTIKLYNLDHTLYKNISFSAAPSTPPEFRPYIMYISEHLFDLDDDIEYLFTVLMSGNQAITMVYDETGALILDATDGYPAVLPTYHSQHYPIYNSSEGTKLILSFEDGTARVFALPGSLSLGVANGSEQEVQAAQQRAWAFPVPSSGWVSIELPEALATAPGELQVFNAAGQLVAVAPVLNNSRTVQVDLGPLAVGSYQYRIFSEGTVHYTGPLEVVR